MARTKIALIYITGSMVMTVNRKTGRTEPIESLSDIHRMLPELQREVSIEFFRFESQSPELQPEEWSHLSSFITQLYDQFEGFVVVHNTDTLVYSACAVSFALQSLSKPVVFTGAQLPMNDLESDARMNIIYAMRAAQLDIAEVCIVMGPHVLRATRSKKVDQSILRSFDSPKLPPLASFHLGVDLHPWRIVRRKRRLQCKESFNSNVALVTLQPGLSQSYLDAVLDADLSGIVLRAYGPGMVPEYIVPWVRQVCERDIPLVFTSQVVRGKVDLHQHRKQLTFERMGIISGKDMSFECAVVKLMWALAYAKNTRRVREIMEKNLVGELE